MRIDLHAGRASAAAPQAGGVVRAKPDRHAHGGSILRPWTSPVAEVVCLACELSAYAPDEGDPLF
jgi:hypothetical protein